eukprot:531158_1
MPRRSTIFSDVSSHNTLCGKCCNYVVRSIQYLVGIAVILGYFLFLPIIPYFALFSEQYGYLQMGHINQEDWDCTYDEVTIDHSNNILSENRSDKVYWQMFLIFCIISSIFGYWMVIIIPAFKLCLNIRNWKYNCSKFDCFSWKTWVISSIISLVFVIAALALAFEKPCKHEVIILYKNNNENNDDIHVNDIELGYCVWYLIVLIILNIMIIGICIWMRNDQYFSQYKESFHVTFNNYNTYKNTNIYSCEKCNDTGYVTKYCCLNKQRCSVCTSWKELELDHF